MNYTHILVDRQFIHLTIGRLIGRPRGSLKRVHMNLALSEGTEGLLLSSNKIKRLVVCRLSWCRNNFYDKNSTCFSRIDMVHALCVVLELMPKKSHVIFHSYECYRHDSISNNELFSHEKVAASRGQKCYDFSMNHAWLNWEYLEKWERRWKFIYIDCENEDK